MAAELDAQRTISSEDECWAAFEGFWYGDLIPLAEYLEQQTGTLHPLVQRLIAEMIRGVEPIGGKMEPTRWRIVIESNAGRGAPKNPNPERDRLLVRYYDEAQPARGRRKQMLHEVAARVTLEMGLESDSVSAWTVMRAVKERDRLRSVMLQRMRLMREEAEQAEQELK